MISHTAQSQHHTLLVIKAELQHLRLRLPVYASWRIRDLEWAVKRYKALLLWAIDTGLPKVPSKELSASLLVIEQDMRDVLSTGDWRPFNRAVTAVEWDIDEVLKFLPGGSSASPGPASTSLSAN